MGVSGCVDGDDDGNKGMRIANARNKASGNLFFRKNFPLTNFRSKISAGKISSIRFPPADFYLKNIIEVRQDFL